MGALAYRGSPWNHRGRAGSWPGYSSIDREQSASGPGKTGVGHQAAAAKGSKDCSACCDIQRTTGVEASPSAAHRCPSASALGSTSCQSENAASPVGKTRCLDEGKGHRSAGDPTFEPLMGAVSLQAQPYLRGAHKRCRSSTRRNGGTGELDLESAVRRFPLQLLAAVSTGQRPKWQFAAKRFQASLRNAYESNTVSRSGPRR